MVVGRGLQRLNPFCLATVSLQILPLKLSFIVGPWIVCAFDTSTTVSKPQLWLDLRRLPPFIPSPMTPASNKENGENKDPVYRALLDLFVGTRACFGDAKVESPKGAAVDGILLQGGPDPTRAVTGGGLPQLYVNGGDVIVTGGELYGKNIDLTLKRSREERVNALLAAIRGKQHIILLLPCNKKDSGADFLDLFRFAMRQQLVYHQVHGVKTQIMAGVTSKEMLDACMEASKDSRSKLKNGVIFVLPPEPRLWFHAMNRSDL